MQVAIMTCVISVLQCQCYMQLYIITIIIKKYHIPCCELAVLENSWELLKLLTLGNCCKFSGPDCIYIIILNVCYFICIHVYIPTKDPITCYNLVQGT